MCKYIATHLQELDSISATGAEQRVYRCDPPLDGSEYVCVSAVNAMFGGPETYIFSCTKEGHITGWGELTGSFRGELNHEKALKNAGYEIKVLN